MIGTRRDIDPDVEDLYRRMVKERHQIWLNRQSNAPQPWTNDPVLANLKMTNMFRVLAPGSQFVFELDGPNPTDVIARLVFYRLTNLPKTWRVLRNGLGYFPKAKDFTHRPQTLIDILVSYRDDGNRVFSGAYIIVPEPGTTNDKVEGAVRVTKTFVENNAWDFLRATTQEDMYRILKSTPGLGPFLSMQILTDWNYLQVEEPDLTFVVAGPGARRGTAFLSRSMKPEAVIYDAALSWVDDPTVRLQGRSLTVMDVQNTFCEFSKYAREISSPRKKTPYKPANPGPQPRPVLPMWW